jgi:hypothetical protein
MDMENNLNQKSSARDIFLHLLHTVMLIVSVIGLLTLLFGYFDVLFPDQLNFYLSDYLDQIRLATSVLVIVFPVYILISWILGRDYKKDPAKRGIRARRVFGYITLFAAAITVIVDLVTLIYRFYSGDYSVQFLMKILSVLIVAAVVFGYYLWDIRREYIRSTKPKLYAWISSAVILAVVIGGFFVVGSPATQRDRRFDETRINDLQTIQNQVISYWQSKNKLPATLGDLKNSISGFVAPTDPQTGASYEYIISGPLVFQLCADFKTDSKYDSANPPVAVPMSYPYNGNWDHGVGRICFSRTIDPQLYKNPALITP